jgi:DtxR family transcriptional regulator, Mn-dependent transcriptional regulator
MNDSTGPLLTDELLEDCLQSVHRIAAQGRTATIVEIAAFARVAPAKVADALVELRARGLVVADPPDRIALTPDGQKLAAGILRRHRLSERLLTDVLGLPWDRVHDEAMRLEHSLTPEAEARLESLLNHPETCPHGAPIPVPTGSALAQTTRTLDRVSVGTRVRIEQVAEEDGALLRYLASLGLFPQARLTVEEAAPFGGPLLVQVNGARYAIGREVAAKILVSGEPDDPTGPVRTRHRWRRGR